MADDNHKLLSLLGLGRERTKELAKKHKNDTIGAVCEAIVPLLKDEEAMKIFGFGKVDVLVLMETTGCSEQEAIAKLIEFKGEILEAAMSITEKKGSVPPLETRERRTPFYFGPRLRAHICYSKHW
nr:ubiquitin associated domain containing protein [Marseillevirus futianmevirus]